MNYLLIISCSQRKIENAIGQNGCESTAAIDVYDGNAYRVLRKLRREGRAPENVDVLLISAKYGLIDAQTPISPYDQQMTPERAAELAPEVQSKIRRFMIAYVGLGCGATIDFYDQVFINLGKTYRQTLDGFHWGLVSTLEASGGIGQKTAQMKAWLERIYSEGTDDVS